MLYDLRYLSIILTARSEDTKPSRLKQDSGYGSSWGSHPPALTALGALKQSTNTELILKAEQGGILWPGAGPSPRVHGIPPEDALERAVQLPAKSSSLVQAAALGAPQGAGPAAGGCVRAGNPWDSSCAELFLLSYSRKSLAASELGATPDSSPVLCLQDGEGHRLPGGTHRPLRPGCVHATPEQPPEPPGAENVGRSRAGQGCTHLLQGSSVRALPCKGRELGASCR